LVFKGTFESTESISDDVALFPIGQDLKDAAAAPSKTGTFKATRVSAKKPPSVQLLSPNSGVKPKKGQDVDVDWQLNR
jgi:hypothetical protein